MKIIRFILFPFAVIYGLVTSIRNFCYDIGIFKSTFFDIPVIAVGNLSVGGTGKTPQIEYLIRLLQDDKKVAVLSRGYKRKTNGFILLNETYTAEDVGDEPLQFFKKFPNISVAVDADRVNGIRALITKVNPDVVLLDDAFQHRKVKASFYILLTKYNDLFTKDFMLPTGNLRESRKGAKRANIIVVTKCPENITANQKNTVSESLHLRKNQQLFFSTIAYNASTKGSNNVALEELHNYEILLVTGIANPTPLLDFLIQKKCKVNHMAFADHHNFTESDISNIQSKFNQLQSNKLLLTTEKDYMRLKGRVEGLSYIEIQSNFLENTTGFNAAIKQCCNINS